MSTRSIGAVCLLVGIALAACGPTDRPPDAVVEDTVVDVQPRTDAEIEREAQPMTPEQAEELGVVDTTIRVTDEP